MISDLYHRVDPPLQNEQSLQTELQVLRQKISCYEQIAAEFAILDRQMCYLAVSQNWRDRYGLNGEDLICAEDLCSVDAFFDRETTPNIPQRLQEISQDYLDGKNNTYEEDFFVSLGGVTQWLNWEINPWYDDDGEFGGLSVIQEVFSAENSNCLDSNSSDFNSPKLAQRLLNLQFSVTEVLADSIDLDRAISKLLQLFCEGLGWDLAEFWMVDNQNDSLSYLTGWDISTQKSSGFTALSLGRKIAIQTQSCKRSVWIDDINENNGTKNTFHAVLSFPIVCGGEIFGITNLFSQSMRCQDNGLLQILDVLGKQLAQFIKCKQAEESSIKNRTRMQQMAENVPGMIYEFRLGADGRQSFPYVSAGCKEIYGIDAAQIVKDADILFNTTHPDDLTGFLQTVIESAQTLENWTYKWRVITPTGEQKWVKGVSRPVPQTGGDILWYGCIIDISEQQVALQKRKIVEASLKKLNEELEARVEERTQQLSQSKEQFQQLADNIPGMIYELRFNPNGTMSFTYVSSGCWEIYELDPSLVQQNPQVLFDIVHPDERVNLKQTIYDSARNLQNYEHKWRINLPSGKQKWLKGFSKPQAQPDGSILCHGCIIDITKSELAEQERQIFVSLIENSSDLIGIATLEGKFLYVNEAGLKLLGINSLAEAKKSYIAQSFLPEDRKDVQQRIIPAVMDNGLYHSEYRFRHYQTGETIPVDCNMFLIKNPQTGEPLYFATITRDIRDRKQVDIKFKQQAEELENSLLELQSTQTQLIQSEKMSSLGQMVAGIAHEINNPVGFVYGNIAPCREYTQDLLQLIELYQNYYSHPPEEIQELIEAVDLDFIKTDILRLLGSMHEGTRRIREIVLSLRNFSRLDESEFKQVDIHTGIDSTLMLLQNRLKSKPGYSGVEVIKDYAELPLIQCYPSQLNQVLMNILVNAIDAIDSQIKNQEGHKNAQIHILTKVLPSGWIAINISDNGPGIPEKIRSKLFDPFFTTKDVGKGTGLGLSISYQIIVEKHHGKLYCQSTPEKGTSFTIEIPTKQESEDGIKD